FLFIENLLSIEPRLSHAVRAEALRCSSSSMPLPGRAPADARHYSCLIFTIESEWYAVTLITVLGENRAELGKPLTRARLTPFFLSFLDFSIPTSKGCVDPTLNRIPALGPLEYTCAEWRRNEAEYDSGVAGRHCRRGGLECMEFLHSDATRPIL